MKMPINYTTVTPSLPLQLELVRLKSIAAVSHLMGLYDLKEQAITAHDCLINSYNNQLPDNKPKGFWGQLKDNLLFRELDRTFTLRLSPLRDSQDLLDAISIFSKSSQPELYNMLNQLINNRY